MTKLALLISVLALAPFAEASWYWPFGDDDDDKDEPRLSELMEPATELIDDASDLAADGKVEEAVKKYREALVALAKVEAENPERVKAPEFATLKTKRAYVNAAIDTLLMREAKENARAVAVSDTTELEKRLAEERAAKAGKPKPKTVKEKEKTEREEMAKKRSEGKEREQDESEKAKEKDEKPSSGVAKAKDGQPAKEKSGKTRPLTRREQAMKDIAEKNFDEAAKTIAAMLEEKPNNAAALNLKATMEIERGDLKAAEAALDQAIASNPRSYYAYYNMAWLYLDTGRKEGARRFYETGRAFDGPEDAELEAALR